VLARTISNLTDRPLFLRISFYSVAFSSFGNVVSNYNIGHMGNSVASYGISLYELSPDMSLISREGARAYLYSVTSVTAGAGIA
jgi:hypothetical protein